MISAKMHFMYCNNITKLLVKRHFSYCSMVIPLFFIPLLSLLSLGMHKQFASPQNSIQEVTVKRSINMRLSF